MTRKIPPETIIFRILSEVRDGKADSDELVRLLEQFCEKSRKELSTNPELAYVVQSIFAGFSFFSGIVPCCFTFRNRVSRAQKTFISN